MVFADVVIDLGGYLYSGVDRWLEGQGLEPRLEPRLESRLEPSWSQAWESSLEVEAWVVVASRSGGFGASRGLREQGGCGHLCR